MFKKNELRLLLVAILLLVTEYGLCAPPSLKFGLFPYLNPTALIKAEKSLKLPIVSATKQRVSLVSAPDMELFIERLKKGKYDLVYVPPHLARLAQRDFGYHSIVGMKSLKYDFVVREDSGIDGMEDLRNATIAVTSPQSLAYSLVLDALPRLGLKTGEKLHFCTQLAHDNSLKALLDGSCDIAIVIPEWKKILQSSESRNQLKVIASIDSPLGPVIMAHPRLDAKLVQHIQQKMLSFHHTTEGKAYIARKNSGSFIIINEEKLVLFDRILEKTLDNK